MLLMLLEERPLGPLLSVPELTLVSYKTGGGGCVLRKGCK